MAAWITIYLKDFVDALTINDIKKGVEPTDWWTLGEYHDMEEDEVDEYMESLVWSNDPLKIGHDGKRPIQIHIWNSHERVKEELEEILEREPPVRVCNHLKEVKTVIALEFGFPQLDTMLGSVAMEVAYWLAETKKGLICSPDDLWFDHAKNRFEPIENEIILSNQNGTEKRIYSKYFDEPINVYNENCNKKFEFYLSFDFQTNTGKLEIPNCGGMVDNFPKSQLQQQWTEQKLSSLNVKNTWTTCWDFLDKEAYLQFIKILQTENAEFQ